MTKGTTYNFENPLLAVFEEAHAVLAAMRARIMNYGAVSVWRFNDFCGIDNNTEENRRYAWTSIPKIGLHKVHGDWSLNLPQPIELTEEQAESLHRLEGFTR